MMKTSIFVLTKQIYSFYFTFGQSLIRQAIGRINYGKTFILVSSFYGMLAAYLVLFVTNLIEFIYFVSLENLTTTVAASLYIWAPLLVLYVSFIIFICVLPGLMVVSIIQTHVESYQTRFWWSFIAMEIYSILLHLVVNVRMDFQSLLYTLGKSVITIMLFLVVFNRLMKYKQSHSKKNSIKYHISNGK